MLFVISFLKAIVHGVNGSFALAVALGSGKVVFLHQQKRGGGALLNLLDRAYGQAPDPQPWFEVPERFAVALELMHRADDAQSTADGR